MVTDTRRRSAQPVGKPCLVDQMDGTRGLAKVRDQPDGGIKRKTVNLIAAGQNQRIASADLTEDGLVLGTARYMPPEQARGEVETLDDRADVYSLGAILYQILTLHPPYDAANPWKVVAQVIEGPPSASSGCRAT